MNKGDLINKLAKVAGTRKEAEAAINSILGSITKALKKGNTVTLIGFGTFSVTKRAARKGRNPQTGKEIKIAARKVLKFTPGKGLNMNGLVEEIEKSLINQAIQKSKGVKSKAAELLGLKRTTLLEKMKKLEIDFS